MKTRRRRLSAMKNLPREAAGDSNGCHGYAGC